MHPNPRRRWRCKIDRVARRALEALAGGVVHTAPRAWTYDIFVRLSGLIQVPARWLYRVLRPGDPPRDYRALLLRDMLCVATRKGGIPIRAELRGRDLVDRAYAEHGRLILCTAHFGLTLAIFSALEARGLSPAAVGEVSRKRDRLHWGCTEPVDLIESDRLCFVRARQALKAGEVVTVFPEVPRPQADKSGPGEHSFDVEPNAFEFAHQVAVPVLFFGARLGPTGAIMLDIVEPAHSLPHSAAEADALAREYCAFLEERSGRPCRLAARAGRLSR